MKKKISKCVAGIIGDFSREQICDMIETPPDEDMGDVAIPCFLFAKSLHKSPAIIAEDLKNELEKDKDCLGIDRVESMNGYCNIYFDRKKYVQQCLEKALEKDFGISKPGISKTICMDYSSPNIAKNFHVGHLRTTVIGNSLYMIFSKLGYKVVRINHLGDWGTQFGKLIVAYKKWSSKEEVEEKGIDELLRIYVKFNSETENNPELMDEARAWFVKMEQNDPEALAIWKWFKEISLQEFERVYDMLGVSFDSYKGESFYRDKVGKLVDELEAKNLLKESQGANIIDLEEYGMPPCLITKKDGGSIYHSRDIAAVLYRKETYDFYKCLYVTGLEQSLHFKQVFKAIELMGYDCYQGLVHVPYGLVSLKGEKLSSRTGNIIYAEDILNEATSRALDAIQKKNPQIKDKENLAKQIGVGAVIFHDLFNQRIKNVDFSWDEVLSFDGTTGPYVQYTYARAKSIIKKYEKPIQPITVDYSALTDDTTYALIKILGGYEDAIKNAAERYEPSIIARYIISLATAFNKFYNDCPILREENASRKEARVFIVDTVQAVIKDACSLLGMQCPDEM